MINHLSLREPVPDATVEGARNGMQLVVDAGALAARVAKVDETRDEDSPEAPSASTQLRWKLMAREATPLS